MILLVLYVGVLSLVFALCRIAGAHVNGPMVADTVQSIRHRRHTDAIPLTAARRAEFAQLESDPYRD